MTTQRNYFPVERRRKRDSDITTPIGIAIFLTGIATGMLIALILQILTHGA